MKTCFIIHESLPLSLLITMLILHFSRPSSLASDSPS